MEQLIKHKVWVVWLLAAVLALPFAVKTVHIYQNNIHAEHENCSEHSHSHHDCDNCPVCRFTLLTFTEATYIDYDFSIIPVCVVFAIPYRNSVYQRILFSYGLRAPPAV